MTHRHNILGMVRLRFAGGGGGNTVTGELTVPAGMMRLLTAGTLFKPEFTDEGILYRFVGGDDDAADVLLPDWAKS